MSLKSFAICEKKILMPRYRGSLSTRPFFHGCTTYNIFYSNTLKKLIYKSRRNSINFLVPLTKLMTCTLQNPTSPLLMKSYEEAQSLCCTMCKETRPERKSSTITICRVIMTCKVFSLPRSNDSPKS